MSDTDKCPKCGCDLIWCENARPVFAYCADTQDCCYETARKDMEPDLVASAAMHRIRELEASRDAFIRICQETEAERDIAVKTRNDALEHERRRIAELEAQLVLASKLVQSNRLAKWQAQNDLANTEGGKE